MALWTVYLSLGLLVALNASACEEGWAYFECRCFKFFNINSSWDGAEFGCLSNKGNLASVHNHDEYVFIQNLITQTTQQSTRTWIGGHKGYYRWFWSDGTKMDYEIWSPVQPSNGTYELCVEMNSDDGNWNDVNCREVLPYVCVK
ncbi:galactose-specific lectin nattectin-like isoform X3 [Chanodichthys erythropterus]|uniref:galactose-specific lectin nattectin-like isoform X3 n=1 Tax=Chanodichthys erythropterus TaxID=933992 RepID=UPI00351EC338